VRQMPRQSKAFSRTRIHIVRNALVSTLDRQARDRRKRISGRPAGVGQRT
jgi:hypothetical protein